MSRARRFGLWVHLWIGLVLGLFWAVQGLTGAALAFNRDIQASALAPAGDGARLPLDTVLARAGAALGAKVTRLETFGPDRLLWLAYYDAGAGERTGVIDARSGRLLERRDPAAAWPSGGATWGWLLRLHEALLAGDAGQLVVGTSGLILFTGILLGLWNALPYRRWRTNWRLARMPRRSRQQLLGWHRLIGLAVAPALIATVACGIYLAFAPQLRAMLAGAGAYHPAYKPAPALARPAIRIDAERAYAAARARFPGATMVRLILPTAKSPVYYFRLLQPDDERRWAGTSTVAIDPTSGAIVDAYDSRTGPLANRITDTLYSIHTGDVAGPIGRLLILLAGLSLPTFAVTGWLGWLRRERLAS